MSIMKFLKFSLAGLLLTLFLASCDKSDIGNLDGPEIRENASLLNNFSNSMEEDSEYQDSLDCFALVYPITVIYPDGTETSLGSDQELDDALDAWFQANENAESYPTFKFPIQVSLSAGTIQDVNSEEELEELIYNCYDYEECEYLEDYEGEIEDLCFSFSYPITISFPDGTTQSVDNDSTFENLVEQWFMTNGENAEDPTLVYPVDLILEDGALQTVNSDEELYAVLDECFDDFENDEYGHEYDDEYENEFEDDCFALVFPITIQLPNGSTTTANNEDDLEEIFDNYFDTVSDTTESFPMFIYPVDIVWADSTTQTIHSEEELEVAFGMCYDDYEIGEDFEDLCFDIDYPITILLPDNTSVEANSDDEAEDIVEKWYDDNGETAGDPTLSFPITITKEDGSKEAINSEEELEAAIVLCYHG